MLCVAASLSYFVYMLEGYRPHRRVNVAIFTWTTSFGIFAFSLFLFGGGAQD